MDKIAQLEFGLAHYDDTVQHVSHYDRGTTQVYSKKEIPPTVFKPAESFALKLFVIEFWIFLKNVTSYVGGNVFDCDKICEEISSSDISFREVLSNNNDVNKQTLNT